MTLIVVLLGLAFVFTVCALFVPMFDFTLTVDSIVKVSESRSTALLDAELSGSLVPSYIKGMKAAAFLTLIFVALAAAAKFTGRMYFSKIGIGMAFVSSCALWLLYLVNYKEEGDEIGILNDILGLIPGSAIPGGAEITVKQNKTSTGFLSAVGASVMLAGAGMYSMRMQNTYQRRDIDT
jgi:hypothetical protein